jgi:hypothetical protein
VAAETLLGALVGAIDVGVVRQLARLSDAGVEGLSGLVRAAVAFVSVSFEEVPATVRQRHSSIVRAERRGLDQPFLFEMFEASP